MHTNNKPLNFFLLSIPNNFGQHGIVYESFMGGKLGLEMVYVAPKNTTFKRY